MTIEEANKILRAKRPVSAVSQAAASAKPDAATLRARITEARKTIDVLMTQAKKLRAYKLMSDLSKIDVTLIKLEAELNK